MKNISLFLTLYIVSVFVVSLPTQNPMFETLLNDMNKTCPDLVSTSLFNVRTSYFNACDYFPKQDLSISSLQKYLCVNVIDAIYQLCNTKSKNKIGVPKSYDDLKKIVDESKLTNKQFCQEMKKYPETNYTVTKHYMQQIRKDINDDSKCIKLCYELEPKINPLCVIIYVLNEKIIEAASDTVQEKALVPPSKLEEKSTTKLPGKEPVNEPKKSEKNELNNAGAVSLNPVNESNQKNVESKPDSNQNRELKSNSHQKNSQNNLVISSSPIKSQIPVKDTHSPENPRKQETLPENSETLPENPETLPENPETLPENPKTLPENPKTIPQSQEKTQNQQTDPQNPETGTSIAKSLPETSEKPLQIQEETPTLDLTNHNSVNSETISKKTESPKKTPKKPETTYVNDVKTSSPQKNQSTLNDEYDSITDRENSNDGDVYEQPFDTDNTKPVNNAMVVVPKTKIEYQEIEESNFFTYFMFTSIVFICCYIAYHNKQKILALVLEGRRDRKGRRRPNTAGYRKLNCTLEEAVTSKSGGLATHVIY